MGKGANDFVYYIRRTDGPQGIHFEVAKFDDISGGDQPVSVYAVMWNPNVNYPIGRGKCNCHAATYRATGVNDKHVDMVKWWIAQGEKIQGFRWPQPT